MLIIIASLFLGSGSAQGGSIMSTLAVSAAVILGVVVTLVVSKILSNTILKGVPSFFALEMPPYRKPQIKKIFVRSLLDRTLFVLGRAVMVAAPAGIFIWVLANININNIKLLTLCANFFEPLGYIMGMDGHIILAFVLGIPANEIVLPILAMSYMSASHITDLESLDALRQLFQDNGWTLLTAINVMLFSLMHFPCSTTLLTIKKETKSLKWTFASFVIPTIVGIVVCVALTFVVRTVAFLLM